jgi:hypothetical protein
VERCVADYTLDERAKLREDFQPIAEEYRHANRFSSIGFLTCGLGMMSLFFFLGKSSIPWVLIPFLSGIGFFIWILSKIPPLICPGCNNYLDGRFGRYCPECGSDRFQRGSWFQPSYCPACGKWIGRGKDRQYDIRACTHCGVMLDEKGV